jgi:outer membrane receptor protein involved in Fe transport
MRLLVVSVVLAALATGANADTDRVVRGVIVDEKTSAPVEGALVMGQVDSAQSDQDGGFALAVGADEQHLIVSAPGYAMRSVAVDDVNHVELVESHEVIQVEGQIPRPRRPPPPPPPPPPAERPAAQSYELTSAELRILPGTANDALRAVQVLPGVARLPYSFGGIVMRGTSPRDNAVYLDGIEVPIAFHFGGISSFYPSNMLDGIEVQSGSIDAEYGRAQGGIVEMKSREPRGDKWRTGGSIGLLDTSVLAEGPYRDGAIMMGFRRSYLDIVMAPFVAEDTPLPSYYDAQVKWTIGDAARGGKWSPTTFLALDYLHAITPKPDREDESSVTSFFMRVALPYERTWGPLSMRIVPWVGTNQLHFTSRVNNVIEKFKRPSFPFGTRIDFDRDLSWGDIRWGLDAQGGHLSHFQAGLGHKGDILEQVNGETTADWIDAGLWGETRFLLGRLDVKPGLRVEHYGLTDETVVDPRLALRLPLGESIALRETIGRYHQPPTPGDLDPNGGNPMLKSSYFDAATLGVEFEHDEWSGSLTGYYSHGNHLGLRVERELDFENLGSLGPMFAQLLEKQLGLSFYRTNEGRARNAGLELLLKRTTKQAFWLISYTLSRAQRTDYIDDSQMLVDQRMFGWRPFDLDQRHNLNVAASLALTNWRIGARIQAVSGMPYSPVIRVGRDKQIVDPWSERLPMFFQLDVRADRIWKRCWGTIDLYFDIQNATSRRNIEGRDIDDFGMTTDMRGLPLLPFIGVELIPD